MQTKLNTDVVDGENITLSCNAVYPEAFFVDTFWIFNGSRIKSNDKYKKKHFPLVGTIRTRHKENEDWIDYL